jgi:acyl-CoA thioester hydrolase
VSIQNVKFEWPVTVYYEDTDAGGVVYHANYLKFFERARTEMLRRWGVSQRLLLAQDIGFVVRSMEIDFIQGATLDEQLTVVSMISQQKKASLLFCQELVNADQQVLCRAQVKVACINNKKMRPIAIPLSIFSKELQ